MQNIETIIIYFIVGAFLGSFYNVIAMRSVKNESWIKGRSKCDLCGHTLNALDLIPILSYTIHRGKCRYCKEKIPVQHILSELGFGLVLAYMQPGLTGLILLSVLWINLISDITNKLTITSTIYAGIVAILILNIIQYGLIRDVIISIVLIIVVLLTNYIFYGKDHSFGLGDIDILLIIAVYGGIIYALKALGIGCVVGMVILIPLLISGRLTTKSEVPLVPFLFIGVIIGVII